jgi:hypothetical protein
MTTPTTGATQGVPGPLIPDLNDPALRFSRDTGMAAMLERRRELLAVEMGPEDPNTALLGKSPVGVEGARPAADPDVEDTSSSDAAAEAERQRLVADAAAAAPDLDPTKQSRAQGDDFVELTQDDLKSVRVTMTVNGEEQIVTGEDLLRRAQKTAAADDYLETARNVLHEVKALRAGTSVAPSQEPAAPAATAKPADVEARDKAIEETFDLMFTGQMDEAKAKFREIFAATTAQPADVDALIELKFKEKVIKQELRQFRETHKDIIADKNASRQADEFLYQDLARRKVARLEDLPAEEVADVLNNAAASFREWNPRFANGATPGGTGSSTATSLRDKLSRKQKSDELPTASLRSDTSVPGIKSVQEKLNDMRKARGQPVA